MSLYGAGFAGGNTAAASCHAGGQQATVTYAGAQTQIPGLDQINLILPSALAGRGSISVDPVRLTVQ